MIKTDRVFIFSLSISFLYLFLCYLSLLAYATELPDAKSIPKPILMLGLYCNSAKIVMKKRFDLDPTAPPWYAVGRKKEEIDGLFKIVDMNDSGYAKSVNDTALTRDEANFIKFTATHEATLWLKNIYVSCSIYPDNSYEYDTCLQDNNSEIYKCYRQLKDQIKSTKN